MLKNQEKNKMVKKLINDGKGGSHYSYGSAPVGTYKNDPELTKNLQNYLGLFIVGRRGEIPSEYLGALEGMEKAKGSGLNSSDQIKLGNGRLELPNINTIPTRPIGNMFSKPPQDRWYPEDPNRPNAPTTPTRPDLTQKIGVPKTPITPKPPQDRWYPEDPNRPNAPTTPTRPDLTKSIFNASPLNNWKKKQIIKNNISSRPTYTPQQQMKNMTGNL